MLFLINNNIDCILQNIIDIFAFSIARFFMKLHYVWIFKTFLYKYNILYYDFNIPEMF